MSTVSGLAAKGEKGKSKFQSLDINSLYRTSLGESLEPQQKALPRKHGMQSLGKVPSARRPPANLPSLKSEHSGQDPAISLVPTGGAGWGSKGEGGGNTAPSSSSSTVPSNTQQSTSQAQVSAVAVATASSTQHVPAPVIATAPTLSSNQNSGSVSVVSGAQNSGTSSPPVTQQQQQQQQQQQPPQQQVHTATQQTQPQVSRGSSGQEKLWSSLMSGGNSAGGQDGPSFLAHQSPMFQHEFPSLSAEQGAAKTTTTQDTQYGPGPSLRPQTEGSWIQGGMSRTGESGAVRAGVPPDGAGNRNNSGQQAPTQQASAQAGQPNAAPLPPQLRGIIPSFMYRGNFAPGGTGPGYPANYTGGNIPPQQRGQRYPEGGPARTQQGPRYAQSGNDPNARRIDEESFISRPIIKEEDLKQLDEITRDNGWATSDDIDYNQKLAFSDDEGQDDDSQGQQRQPGQRGRGQQQQQQAGQTGEQPLGKENEQPRIRQQQQSGHPDDRRGGRGEAPRQWQGGPTQQGQPRIPPDFHRQGPQFPGGMKIQMFPPGPGGPPSAGTIPPATANNTARMMEDDEVWRERRRQQSEEVALAVERAKQRKEEEEKRFKETREAAAKKLQMLEVKMGVAPSSAQLERSDSRENNTPSPGSVTEKSKPSLPSPQPTGASQQQECWASAGEEKPAVEKQPTSQPQQQQQQQNQQEFRQTQHNQEHNNGAPSYSQERERERELRKERGDRTNDRHEPMPFSPKFSEDLPPRFAKQKQMLLRSGGPQQGQAGSGGNQTQAPPSNTPPPLLATPVQPPPNFEQQRWGSQHFSNQGKGRRRGPAQDIADDERPPSRDREALRQDKNRDRHTPEQDTRQDRYNRGGRGHHGNRQQYFDVDFRANRAEQDYERRNSREGEDQWQRDDWQQSKDNKSHEGSAERHLQDPFEEKENWSSGATPPPLMGVSDWRAGGDNKEWGESRPQRPDSRDSKASSRDSRHSHDKLPLSSQQQLEGGDHKPSAWSTDNYYDKEDKNNDRLNQRKGDDRRGSKRGGASGADKADTKESRSELWPRGEERGNTNSLTALMSKSWAEAVPDAEHAPQSTSPSLDLPGGSNKLGSLISSDNVTAKKDDLDSCKTEGEGRGVEGKGSRSRGRNRDSRSPRNSGSGGSSSGWSGYPVFPKTWGRSGSGASEGRGRGSTRGGTSRLHPGGGRANYGWEDDSDLSGDELLPGTEGNKDDSRRLRKSPRSPKRGSSAGKKETKEEKPPSVIGEQRKTADKAAVKPVGTRGEGFAPRGEPSRRGRGGGGSSRPRGGLGRGIDGYGPPAKSPFGPRDDSKKTDSEKKLDDEDTKTKLGGMVPLSNAISNATRQNKPSAVPPRLQKTRGGGVGEPERGSRRRGRGGRSPNRSGGVMKQNSSDANEECWETTSENSDEERKGGSRRGGMSQRNKGAGPVSRPMSQQFSSSNQVSQPTSKAPGAEKKNGLGSAVVRPPVSQQNVSRPTARHSPSPLIKKEGSPGLDLKSEADKKQRLEKEKSALDALDISTYAAVTSMVEEQVQQSQLDSENVSQQQYFGSFDTSNGFHHPGQRKKPPTPPITPPTNNQQQNNQNRGPPPMGRGKMQQQQGNLPPGTMQQGPPPPRENKQPGGKPGYDRSRVSKLPPRLAKQKENNRLQKAAAANAMQHHMGAQDMLDMYNSMKDGVTAQMNAWDKPLSGPMRTGSPLTGLPPNADPCGQLVDQNDGVMNVPGDMTVNKMTREGEDNADMKLDFAFDSELLSDDKKRSAMQHHHAGVTSAPSVSVGVTNSSISPSTAELNLKIASVKKVWENASTMPTVHEHTVEDVSGQAFVSPGFEQTLDQAVYKEQTSGEEGSLPADVTYSGQVMVSGSYTVAPGVVTSLGKTDAAAAATSSNVCKVKPQQQAVMNSGPSPIGHPSQLSPPPFTSNSAQQGHMGYAPVGRGTGVENVSCWQPALGGGATQFGGISAIPSPPTVLFNTASQQMAAAQGGLYGAFQLTDGQARSQFSQYPPFGMGANNAAASFSQQSLYLQTAPPPPPPPAPASDMYPPPSMSQYRMQPNAAAFGQTQHVTSNPSTVLISTSSNSLMSASVKPSSQQIGAIGSKGYQATAPPPPQPSPMYMYDHSVAAASLLNLQGQNFMSSSPQLVQRSGPVQSNVVPNIQPPTSFFSNSAPGQTGYYQTGNSGLQPPHAAPTLHSGANPYASMSGYAPAQSGNAAAAVGLQGFSSQERYGMLQMAAAAAAAQQYRSSAAAANYLKSTSQPPPQQTQVPPPQQQQQQTDLSGRSLKSPSSAELGVFSAANQMQQSSSPKSRGGMQANNKQPSLPSPTLGGPGSQHKFGSYPTANSLGLQQQQTQGRGNSGNTRGGVGSQAPRYPNPIQRPPSNFQPQSGVQGGGLLGNNPGGNVRPRMPANQQQQRGGTKYFPGQGGSGSSTLIKQTVEKPTEETNGVAASPGNSPATVVVTPGGNKNNSSEESVKNNPTPPSTTNKTTTTSQPENKSSETITKDDKPQPTNVE